MSTPKQLITELGTRFGFEVVTDNVTASQIRLVGRINPAYRRNWMVGMQHLLLQAQKRPWNLDLSRQYFLRGESMVWGWRLIFQHEDINSQCADLVQVLISAPKARFEVEEQALPGVTGQRHTMTSTGKGAAPSGTPPLLVQRRAGG